jgi:hypothetical protein
VMRGDLLRHLRKHGCHLKRDGRSHSLWTNPTTGALEATSSPGRSVGALLYPSSASEPGPNKPLERPGMNRRGQPEPPAAAAHRRAVSRTNDRSQDGQRH